MSSGGVFQLLANEGKADRLIIATALLNQRIQDISCLRRSMGKDPAPTLSDLEKTHVLFINAHFKPFAALGCEYNKVQAQSGNPQLDGTVLFSIPQFGDFFHDMVVRVVFTRTFGTPAPTPSAGDTATAYGMLSTFPNDGRDWDDADGGLPNATYQLVDAFGTAVTAGNGAQYTNMLRYCDFVGERAFKNVAFTVNGNPLDEYTDVVPTLLRKTMMSDEKLYGYKKLVGQEVPFDGYTGPRICPVVDTHWDVAATAAAVAASATTASHGSNSTVVAGSAQNRGTATATYLTNPRHTGGDFHPAQHQHIPAQGVPATLDGVLQPIGQARGGGPTFSGAATDSGVWPADAPVAHVQRGALKAVDGPQTPKYMHHELEIWNRLWFWFNLDARLSIPSVCIPYGQRFINIKLAPANELVQDFPGLYVEQTVTSLNPVAAHNDATITRNYRPYWAALQFTPPTVRTIEMYINNIFVNPEIHDLFISRVGFSLIRVYRQQRTNVNQSGEQQVLLSQLKWPVECIIFGFQPSWNRDLRNINFSHDWQVFGKPFSSVCELQQQALTGYDAGGNLASSAIGQIVKDEFQIDRPIVTTVALTAHGVPIFKDFPQAFFSTYMPFHFGGDAVRPPQDSGVMMMNFALFIGCYQPSGYINISRARELYLSWQGSYIDATRPADMVAISIALNFLLITDGSAVLRYTT